MADTSTSLPEGLLAAVKAYLQITWTETGTDDRITGLCQDGIAYINSKYGGEANYLTPGLPRTLLQEYVRYARDSALDVFEINYRSLIVALQNERRVSAFVETSDAAQE